MKFEKRRNSVKVSGDAGEVKALLMSWQDKLWPEWRISQRARDQIARLARHIEREGYLLFDTRVRQCRDAFFAATQSCLV